MTPTVIALIAFACVFGGALLGMGLGLVLPQHHLSAESKDVVKLGMGLVATLAALVLGLVVASAKGAFDSLDGEVKHLAADVLLLDRTLAHYGPETKEIRDQLRGVVALRLALTWPEDRTQPVAVDAPEMTPTVEAIEEGVLALTPQNDAQRWRQSRALELTRDLQGGRWLALESLGDSVPLPFLAVVVFWLTMLFGSFGLYAPRNATVVAALLVCAMSSALAMFLILEMGRPFDGLLKVSAAPLRYTLAHLDE